MDSDVSHPSLETSVQGSAPKWTGRTVERWWPGSDFGEVARSRHSIQEDMMRKSRQWTGFRAGVLALSLVSLAATSGRADALMNYSTSGSIDSTGVSGPGIISFIPVSTNQFNAPSAFSLGDFQVAALP